MKRKRDRQTETNRQSDRQTEIERAERERERRERDRDRQTDRDRDRQTDRETETERQRDRERQRERDRGSERARERERESSEEFSRVEFREGNQSLEFGVVGQWGMSGDGGRENGGRKRPGWLELKPHSHGETTHRSPFTALKVAALPRHTWPASNLCCSSTAA